MPILDRLAAASLPWVPKPVVRRLSRRYIAGEHRDEALALGADLAATGYRLTYDVLGEAVTDPSGVQAAAAEYRALLSALDAAKLEVNLSVKPTHMGLHLDEEACLQTVSGLAAEIQAVNGFLRFEMEDSETTEATLRVFASLREQFGATVGCVIQSMLHRSESDVDRLLQTSAPLNVRLVKGVYVEPAAIAWQQDAEICASYQRILEKLLAGGAFVGVATHDEKLFAGMKTALEQRPAAREHCEVQMLLGVREDLRAGLRAEGMPLRVYVPYGRDWHAYVLRRLRSNPKLARYALKGMFSRREDLSSA